MKKILFSLLIIIGSVSVHSQNILYGTITDKSTGSTLPNATLYFTDLMKGASADIDGKYTIDNLPSGSFLLQVTYLGFRSWVSKVDITGKTKLDISLTPAAAEMKEVIITGTTSSVERRLNPVPSIILNFDDLKVSNSTTIMDALSRKPGISQVTTGSGISKPVIRGLGYNRVVELVDGVRQEDQQWGDEHGVEIDDYSVNRVEVIKGPGSIMYGSDAMAGVINYLYPAPLEQGTVGLNVTSEFQTNNRLEGLSAASAGNLKGINWLLRGSLKRAGNFTNNEDGHVYNSGFREMNTNGYLGLNRKWGYSQLLYSAFHEKVGLAEGQRDSQGRFVKPVIVNDSTLSEATTNESDLNGYSLAVPWQELLHLKLVSSSSVLLGKSRVSMKIGYQQNRRSEFGNPLLPDQASLYLKLNTLTYDLKYFLPDLKGWESSVGIGGMIQQNRDGGLEFLVPEYDLKDAGLYVFTRKTMGKLIISGGGRADRRNISSFTMDIKDEGRKFTAITKEFSNISGSIGCSYNLNDSLALKVNVSRGFRSPNIAELASNGKHEGTYHYELGNPDLKPETSLQADAGIDIDKTHLSFEMDIFLNSIQNYIFPEKLNSRNGGDSIIDLKDPAPAFKFMQGNALLYGGEITLDIHPHPYDWIHFENTLGYVRGIRPGRIDSLKNLPMMPPLKLSSQLRIDLNKTPRWLRNLTAFIGGEMTLKQDKVFKAYGTETATPGYFLLNAGIGCEFYGKDDKKLFSININGSNLLDASYQDHLSRLKYAPENPLTGKQGIFNMGRNIGFKLIVPVSWRVGR
ncbi:MAG: TonB-dependent receptor [Bacteroidetes bacterium]|nr:TonB-dependent receptor [Bacteroidota bacterium]